MTATGSRRTRPHPARRARKVAGACSVARMCALTGCFAATAKTSTATQAAAATTTAVVTAAPVAGNGSTTTAAARLRLGAAVASTASTQSDASSHAN